MRKSEKVVFAVAALVVGGMLSIAVPPLVSAVSWASEIATEAAPKPTSTLTEAPAVAESPPIADVPDGYLDMGDGSSIPEGGPGDCTASALISITGEGAVPDTARLLRPENLTDMGPRKSADGDVGYNDDGRITTYTVAPGDSAGAIGDRFCIYNGLALSALNGHKGYELIQPGELLVLNPAAVPGFTFINADAE